MFKETESGEAEISQQVYCPSEYIIMSRICLASASIMSECTQGWTIQRARYVVQRMLKWFDGSESETPPDTTLAALGAVRQHSARKKCVLLAWIALDETLAGK